MVNPKRREKLLAQLTRMREIEHHAAASQAAQALDAQQRSEQLHKRAQSLADAYVDLDGVGTADELSRQMTSGQRLREVAQQVGRRAAEARTLAEVRMHEAHRAKRKLEQLEERKQQLRSEISAQQDKRNLQQNGARRSIGTDRE